MSDNATKLLNILKKHGVLFEGKAIKEMFHKPDYPGQDGEVEKQREFWQWEADVYGNTIQQPVAKLPETFVQKTFPSYDRQMWAAYFELKAAGLVRATNNGTNEYNLVLIKK